MTLRLLAAAALLIASHAEMYDVIDPANTTQCPCAPATWSDVKSSGLSWLSQNYVNSLWRNSANGAKAGSRCALPGAGASDDAAVVQGYLGSWCAGGAGWCWPCWWCW